MQFVGKGRTPVRLREVCRVCVVGIVAITQVAGCAKSPDSIDARYVSPTMYQNWSCEQLVDERTRLVKEVDRVSGLQRENANADTAMMTVGLIVLWPVLFGLAATHDRKDELGRLKGEYEAVDFQMKGKQCSMPAPGAPSVSVPTTPATAAAIADAGGTYKGKGKTDSWCQAPTLTLTVSGNDVTGELSELSSEKKTSDVKGSIFTAGTVSLEFKGSADTYYSGKVDATFKDNMLNVDFKSKAAAACSYHFELKKG
jgi:hypothetical protein